MNDFTSICNQVVSSSTCMAGLSPTTYVGPLCLIQVNRKHICLLYHHLYFFIVSSKSVWYILHISHLQIMSCIFHRFFNI